MPTLDSDLFRNAEIFQPRIAEIRPQHASLIFVDAGVTDLPWLIFSGHDAELIFLSGKDDGLNEIACRLKGRRRLSCVHIFAKLVRGRLIFSDKALRLRELRSGAQALAQIGLAIGRGGELVIGAGESGDGESDYVLRVLEALAGVPVRLWRPPSGTP